jgi:hypothetical protein
MYAGESHKTSNSRNVPSIPAWCLSPSGFPASSLLKGRIQMNTAKDEVRELLDKLPENCSLEDVQYHLYVIEKINGRFKLQMHR